MATDGKVLQLWNALSEKTKPSEAILGFYRLAQEAGRQEGVAALEKELLSDSTVEAVLKNFGWGSRMKGSLITQRAVLQEAVRIAIERVQTERTPAKARLRSTKESFK